MYDPNKGENFRDVELAFTNPEAYIESKTANREMTEKEASKFRKSMKFLSPQFAKLAAGLRTNVIQLAYAIAKANEEGGRFSVSDIQFAMDSIGEGVDEGIFKAKLNTIAARLSTNAYNQYRDVFEKYEDDPTELIRYDINKAKESSLYKGVLENYNYFTRGEEYIKEQQDKKEKEIKEKTPSINEILKKNQDENEGKNE